jgi:hypothetical protein
MKHSKKLYIIALLIFLIAIPAFPQGIFNGCDMDGSTNIEFLKVMNRKKNRYNIPSASDFDSSVKLSSFMEPGDDHERFDENKAVEIIGWVRDVKWGSNESCNCNQTGQNFQDVHIEIVPTRNTTSKKKVIVVEISPRLREDIFDNLNIPMSNSKLRTKIKKHKVKIKGWLLFDWEHITDAVNTDPDDVYYRDNLRATTGEIHPVTSLEIIQ